MWKIPGKSANSNSRLITKSSLWPSGGMDGRKSAKPRGWLSGEGGWRDFMSSRSVTDWLFLQPAKWRLRHTETELLYRNTLLRNIPSFLDLLWPFLNVKNRIPSVFRIFLPRCRFLGHFVGLYIAKLKLSQVWLIV